MRKLFLSVCVLGYFCPAFAGSILLSVSINETPHTRNVFVTWRETAHPTFPPPRSTFDWTVISAPQPNTVLSTANDGLLSNIVFSFTGGPDPVLDFFLRFDSLPAVDGPPIVGRAILSACTPAQNCFYGSTQALLRASSIGPDKETGDAGQGAEIRGRVTSNDVDIFRISISDFSQFSATAIALGLTGSLQPQLFLFREFGPSEQWIAAGVYANARDQNFYGGSILPGISGYPRGFTTSR